MLEPVDALEAIEAALQRAKKDLHSCEGDWAHHVRMIKNYADQALDSDYGLARVSLEPPELLKPGMTS